MTGDTLQSLKFVFKSLWDLLGSFYIPGTILTGQHLLVAPLGAIVFITVFRKVLDIGAADVGSHLRIGSAGGKYRKSNNKGKED